MFQNFYNKALSRFKRHQQFCLFLLVGGLNTIFGYGIFSLLIFLGIHYVWAVFLATLLGVLFNFKTTGQIVFKNKNNRLLFRFLIVYGIQYCINIALIKILLLCSLNLYFAGGISTLICALASYFLSKYFVFVVRS